LNNADLLELNNFQGFVAQNPKPAETSAQGAWIIHFANHLPKQLHSMEIKFSPELAWLPDTIIIDGFSFLKKALDFLQRCSRVLDFFFRKKKSSIMPSCDLR
jgi:hypothetical protein